MLSVRLGAVRGEDDPVPIRCLIEPSLDGVRL